MELFPKIQRSESLLPKMPSLAESLQAELSGGLGFLPEFLRSEDERKGTEALPLGEASKASGYTPATLSGALPHTP